MAKTRKNADRFALAITLGNDAAQTADDVARLLRDVAATLAEHPAKRAGVILDENGNSVGDWAFAGGQR